MRGTGEVSAERKISLPVSNILPFAIRMGANGDPHPICNLYNGSGWVVRASR